MLDTKFTKGLFDMTLLIFILTSGRVLFYPYQIVLMSSYNGVLSMKHWQDVLDDLTKQSMVSDPNESGVEKSVNQLPRDSTHVVDNLVFSDKRYYFDPGSPELYLTCREAQCIYYLLHGLTLVKTAEKLELSHRTVEFYVKNIKMKLNLLTKSELITYMMKVDFLNLLDASSASESHDN